MQKTSKKSPTSKENSSSLEFFKLDEVDRYVFFWLIDNERLRASIPSWLEFIFMDYRQRLHLLLDIDRLFQEAESCGVEKISRNTYMRNQVDLENAS